jgi:hypothetical protein
MYIVVFSYQILLRRTPVEYERARQQKITLNMHR